MSAAQQQQQRGGNGSSRDEVRVFQSTLDKATVTTTSFSQPSFYMGIVNLVLMIFIQQYPREFVTPKMMTMSFNGIKAYRLLTIPFWFIGGAYFMTASLITTAPTPLTGHLLGYCVSLTTGLTMFNFRRVSWYYPMMGVMFLSYGGLHHYRRMMVHGDNAPLFNWSDFSIIWEDMKKQREIRRELKMKQSEARKRAAIS